MKDQPAFPQPASQWVEGANPQSTSGMSLRDWFAGQALANSAICTGTAPEYELKRWFGGRHGIRAAEIVAMQARDYADAMLFARGDAL